MSNTLYGRSLVANEGFVFPTCGDILQITFICKDCGATFIEVLPRSAITETTPTQIFFDPTKLRSNTHCVKCLTEQEEASK